jgi:hypothetical protein
MNDELPCWLIFFLKIEFFIHIFGFMKYFNEILINWIELDAQSIPATPLLHPLNYSSSNRSELQNVPKNTIDTLNDLKPQSLKCLQKFTNLKSNLCLSNMIENWSILFLNHSASQESISVIIAECFSTKIDCSHTESIYSMRIKVCLIDFSGVWNKISRSKTSTGNFQIFIPKFQLKIRKASQRLMQLRLWPYTTFTNNRIVDNLIESKFRSIVSSYSTLMVTSAL